MDAKRLDSLLAAMHRVGATVLHLVPGRAPCVRVQRRFVQAELRQLRLGWRANWFNVGYAVKYTQWAALSLAAARACRGSPGIRRVAGESRSASC